VKATPVPESSPLLPNTIVCDVHRGPEIVGDPSTRRYIACALPVPRLEDGHVRVAELLERVGGEFDTRLLADDRLERLDQAREVVGVESVSTFTVLRLDELVQRLFEEVAGTSSTILPNICTKRRYESYAKRSLSVCCARPLTESSLSPRLRTVSIIPGIENGAPTDGDEQRIDGVAERLPIFCSSARARRRPRPSGRPAACRRRPCRRCTPRS
jgi:hypothetical protein